MLLLYSNQPHRTPIFYVICSLIVPIEDSVRSVSSVYIIPNQTCKQHTRQTGMVFPLGYASYFPSVGQSLTVLIYIVTLSATETKALAWNRPG